MTKMEKTQNKTNFCFRQAADSTVHLLYIYDDVSAYGEFDWKTWSYTESETSAKYFRDQLTAIPAEHTIELHINSNGVPCQSADLFRFHLRFRIPVHLRELL